MRPRPANNRGMETHFACIRNARGQGIDELLLGAETCNVIECALVKAISNHIKPVETLHLRLSIIGGNISKRSWQVNRVDIHYS